MTKEFKIESLGAAIAEVRRKLPFSYSIELHTENGCGCLELKYAGRIEWKKEIGPNDSLTEAYMEALAIAKKSMEFVK